MPFSPSSTNTIIAQQGGLVDAPAGERDNFERSDPVGGKIVE